MKKGARPPPLMTDSRETSLTQEIPLSILKDKIKNLTLLQSQQYLQMAMATQVYDQHEEHELRLIKALLEGQIAILSLDHEDSTSRLFQYEPSIVTLRTMNRFSMTNLSEKSISLRDLQHVLLRCHDQIDISSPLRQVTLQQQLTIRELEKEMSYQQLFNNIEDLLFSQPNYSMEMESIDLEDQMDWLPEKARKSARRRAFYRFLNYSNKIIDLITLK